MADPDPAAWGILLRYRAATGEWRQTSAGVAQAILAAMGAGPEPRPPGSSVRFLRAGSTVRREVRLEDGSLLRPGKPLPAGYHRLGDALLVASPGICPLPVRRQWGIAVQLYAARSRQSWGIGDLADLGRLARWGRRHGAGLVLVNPLHATSPGRQQQPSPYFPSSRRFRNPLYIRIEQVPGANALAGSLAALEDEGRALNDKRHIDRDAVYRLKLAALERLWPGFSDPAFERYRQQMGTALEDFATWCTLAEVHGGLWHAWPSALRHPRSEAVQRFRAQHADRVRFHQW